VGQHGDAGEHGGEVRLEPVDEVVAAPHRPRPGDEHVDGDEAPPAGFPGAQVPEPDALGRVAGQHVVDRGVVDG
jgi:hypothetical protein